MREDFIIINADNTVTIIPNVGNDFVLSEQILAHPGAIGFYFARRV